VKFLIDECLSPVPRSPRAAHTADRRSRSGNAFANRVLINRQRVEKSATSGGNVQTACRWFGSMTIAAMSNG
jgi:hypothetical protein